MYLPIKTYIFWANFTKTCQFWYSFVFQQDKKSQQILESVSPKQTALYTPRTQRTEIGILWS